jgi:peroxiredoxin
MLIEREKAAAAPEFNLTDSRGRQVKLSDYRGKLNLVLVLNRGFG